MPDRSAQDHPFVLEVENLRVSYFTRAGEVNVIPDLSFKLASGEALGLVGESGCGKSTAAYALIRYLGENGRVTGGRVLFEGEDLYAKSPEELRQIWGSRIAMVYQDPMSSLNPSITVGAQLMEVPIIHFDSTPEDAKARAIAILEEVNLPDTEAMMRRYPHQLSGGQQQRVVIAMALIAEPSLLIMDEPTTGLDVTVEAAVLDLVRDLRKRHNASIIFISHNLGTVVRICDRIGVLYAGELVEEGPVKDVFSDPRHPYTRGLLNCIPTLGADKHNTVLEPIPGMMPVRHERKLECVFKERCDYASPESCENQTIPMTPIGREHRVRCSRQEELGAWNRRPAGQSDGKASAKSAPTVLKIDKLKKWYAQSQAGAGFWGGQTQDVKALDGISLSAQLGQTLAIVGESGCGKSTLAKVLTGLERASAGHVTLDDVDIGDLGVDERSGEIIQRLQMVFQNPDSTLNPSHSIGFILSRPLKLIGGLGTAEIDEAVDKLLDSVNLPRSFRGRKPRQLSGGQKQRVAIARALASKPEIIIADEPVSALDVSVQAAIINLMAELQEEKQLTLLFVSHDLSVVRYLADTVAVMYLGKIMEFGQVEDVFSPPYHPYTEALLSAVPIPDPAAQQRRIVLVGKPPSVIDRPKGCAFADRCPLKLGTICENEQPPEHQFENGHRIACHITRENLLVMDPVISFQASQASE